MANTYLTTSTLFRFFAIFSALLSVKASWTEVHKRDAALRFPYGSEKIRGVNLGGWLVLEPWITPSLFDDTGNEDIVDEWTFCSLQETSVAQAALTNHWNTWITESDFAAIAAAGLNHVRIPIGYWAWDISGGEPFIQGQVPYLLQAIEWAQQYGIYVLIDLHGAPGSQNGYDNSGHRGDPYWQTETSYINRTDNIIKILAPEFSAPEYEGVVSAIGALNEPAGYYSSQLLRVTVQYWYDSYGNIRYPWDNSTEGPLLTVIHDAFQPLSYWDGYMPYPDWNGVSIDTHFYQMFSDSEVAYSYSEHISTNCDEGSNIASFESGSGNLWVFVGEWTTAATDCATYLNGRGVGARYDGTYPGSTFVGNCDSTITGSYTGFNSTYLTFLRQMYESQTIAFENGGIGWIYWTWKNEAADEWSYSKGLEGGYIPQNPTDREYPDICD